MVGLEIFGIALVVVSIVYAFIKKQDRLGLALTLLPRSPYPKLFLLGYG